MSDERPIEEVIGWRLYDHGSDPIPSLSHRQWIDRNGDGRVRAEVDDLAAWLNWIDSWPDPSDPLTVTWDEDDRTYTVSGYMIPDGLVTEVGPTIRDALIAAVRKVAAANVTA